MASEHLRRHPHRVTGREDVWWYEEATGICIVVENRTPGGNYIGTKLITIPWRRIRPALVRKDKPRG